MLRKYFFINMLLAVLAGISGFKLYETIVMPPYENPSAVQNRASADTSDAKTENQETKKDMGYFHIIVQKDLFRPSRTEPRPDELSKTAANVPLPRLIGITIIGDENKAFMEDPLTKATRAYKVKDSIAGYIVNEIKNDRVILLRGGEKIEVDMSKVKTVDTPGKMPLPQQPYTPSVSQPPVAPPIYNQPGQIQPHKPMQPPSPAYIPPRAPVPVPPAIPKSHGN